MKVAHVICLVSISLTNIYLYYIKSIEAIAVKKCRKQKLNCGTEKFFRFDLKCMTRFYTGSPDRSAYQKKNNVDNSKIISVTCFEFH